MNNYTLQVNTMLQRTIQTFLLCFAMIISVKAQPYLDLGQAMYSTSPGGDPKTFNHFRAQFNIPLVMKDSGVFDFNPIWEERWTRISGQSEQYHLRGFITWLTYSRNLSSKWSGMLAFVPRWNGEPDIQFSKGFQPGGAMLMTYTKRPGLQFKFGMYYNREFWGNFFIPLLGLDWTISKKQRLFGVLPGYFTYENRISKRISLGGNFRTFTNSYKISNTPAAEPPADFIRVDDNQLGAYADVYLLPKLVLNAEAGYSILRKLRSGYGHTSSDGYNILSNNNAPYFRVTLQYRIRLDK
jgi:Domain of unknown function (DUF6268)